jgi:hypothetical protein
VGDTATIAIHTISCRKVMARSWSANLVCWLCSGGKVWKLEDLVILTVADQDTRDVQLGIGWQRRHASVGDGACFSIECGRADVVAELVDGDERARCELGEDMGVVVRR